MSDGAGKVQGEGKGGEQETGEWGGAGKLGLETEVAKDGKAGGSSRREERLKS